jgi:hypothetical protein
LSEYLEAFVPEPEDIEAGFVTVEKPAYPHFFPPQLKLTK